MNKFATGRNESDQSFSDVIEAIWKEMADRYEHAPRGTKPLALRHLVAKYNQKGMIPKAGTVLQLAKDHYNLKINFTASID